MSVCGSSDGEARRRENLGTAKKMRSRQLGPAKSSWRERRAARPRSSTPVCISCGSGGGATTRRDANGGAEAKSNLLGTLTTPASRWVVKQPAVARHDGSSRASSSRQGVGGAARPSPWQRVQGRLRRPTIRKARQRAKPSRLIFGDAKAAETDQPKQRRLISQSSEKRKSRQRAAK